MRDATVRLLPDLGRRSFVMRQPVGVVVVLIGIEILVGVAGEDLARDELRTVSHKHRIGFNDLNSITTKDSFARQARILRQTHLHRVTT